MMSVLMNFILSGLKMQGLAKLNDQTYLYFLSDKKHSSPKFWKVLAEKPNSHLRKKMMSE